MMTDSDSAGFPGPIIRTFDGHEPRIHPSAWVAPGAVVVGDVEIGADSSIWYGAVLRGDVHHIRIGERSNFQDQCTVHVTLGRFPALIGDEVTVGHRAVVHGCRIEDSALIGIGAIVLDGAEIGENTWVAAGAVVTPGSHVGSGTLVAGIPARSIRSVSADELAVQRERTLGYVETARVHAAGSNSPRENPGRRE